MKLWLKGLAAVFSSFMLLVVLTGCGAEPIEVEMQLEDSLTDEGKTHFLIETNLPDETELILTLKGTSSINDKYEGQCDATVTSGQIEAEFSNLGSPLPEGEYELEVVTPFVETQPETVKKVLGNEGKNLSGNLVVETDNGKIVRFVTEYKMEDLGNYLTEEESVLYDTAIKTLLLYRTLGYKEGVLSIINGMTFLKARYAEHLKMILVDVNWQRTMNGEYYDETDTNAFLLTETSEKIPAGMLMEYDSTTAGFLSLFDENSLLESYYHNYSSEELDHVNVALAQFFSWFEMQYPTDEDYAAAGFMQAAGSMQE